MKPGIILSMTALVLAGCEQTGSESLPNISKTKDKFSLDRRWYTQAQVDMGKPLYLENCAACHQPDASGTKDWRTRLADDSLPPPPLNGTAHTWHHPLKILRYQIVEGGASVGGTMPSFKDKLDSQKVDAVIAWVQSNWSDEIYTRWAEIDASSK